MSDEQAMSDDGGGGGGEEAGGQMFATEIGGRGNMPTYTKATHGVAEVFQQNLLDV